MKAAKVEVRVRFTTKREDSTLTWKKVSADYLLALLRYFTKRFHPTLSQSYVFDHLV